MLVDSLSSESEDVTVSFAITKALFIVKSVYSFPMVALLYQLSQLLRVDVLLYVHLPYDPEIEISRHTGNFNKENLGT